MAGKIPRAVGHFASAVSLKSDEADDDQTIKNDFHSLFNYETTITHCVIRVRHAEHAIRAIATWRAESGASVVGARPISRRRQDGWTRHGQPRTSQSRGLRGRRIQACGTETGWRERLSATSQFHFAPGAGKRMCAMLHSFSSQFHFAPGAGKRM